MSAFELAGPTVISFSGGRTSGYLLHRLLDARGGALPADAVVCFANTGRELEGTLTFVDECARRWGVDVRWLEYRRDPALPRLRRITTARVTFATASRRGEPFEALLTAKRTVPDPFRRFCTQDLKVGVIERHVRAELGWDSWQNVVGLRADETARVEKRLAREASPRWRRRWRSRFPLLDAGVDQLEVRRFWRSQPFDLDVPPEGGNCDGCFMKSSAILRRMFELEPERMAWWADVEDATLGKTFVHRRRYRDLQRAAEAGDAVAWDDGAPCEDFCG